MSLWTAAIVGLTLLAAAGRRAQARLPTTEEAERVDEGTALTLGGQTLKVGIFAFEYGITDRINVGTDPPFWLLRTVESVLVPNLHVKVIAYHRDRLWLTGNVAAYYSTLTKGDASGSLLAIPLTAYASYQIDPTWWVHGELTYNMIFGSGSGDLTQTTLGGVAATRSVQIAMTGEYRVRPTIAITLRGRLQVYTSRLALSSSANPDTFTEVDVDARVTPRHSYPWEIVPAVAFLWRRIRLSAGVGYGNYFVPGMDVPLTARSVVPQATFSVLF